MKIKIITLITIILILPIRGFTQTISEDKLGSALAIALPVGGFAATLFTKDNHQGTFQLTKSYITSYVISRGLKRIIDKPRPDGERFAFPSGHTTSAFTGAAFIQRRYGWAVGAPAYALASYVGYTRIKAKKHDIYDVSAGAILGIGSVYLFTKPFKNDNIKVALSSVGRVYTINASIAIN